MDTSTLISGLPVYIQGIGKLNQPTMSDILKNGQDYYDLLTYPFLVDLSKVISDEQSMEYKPFDLFFLSRDNSEFLLQQQGIPLLVILVEALKLYFDVEIELSMDTKTINIKDQGVINGDNFEELCDVVRQINDKTPQEDEKPPVFQNERQKDIYEKIMAGRKRQQMRDQVNLSTIINTVVHGGKSFIPYREVMQMTFWQLLNSYKTILQMDNWKTNYPVMTVQIDPKDMDLSHWNKLIKI